MQFIKIDYICLNYYEIGVKMDFEFGVKMDVKMDFEMDVKMNEIADNACEVALAINRDAPDLKDRARKLAKITEDLSFLADGLHVNSEISATLNRCAKNSDKHKDEISTFALEISKRKLNDRQINMRLNRLSESIENLACDIIRTNSRIRVIKRKAIQM